jgi:hypothetical protein
MEKFRFAVRAAERDNRLIAPMTRNSPKSENERIRSERERRVCLVGARRRYATHPILENNHLTARKGCNGVRPCCKTCQLADREHECIYGDSILPTSPPPDAPKFREFRHFRYEETFGNAMHTGFRDESSDTTQDDLSPSVRLSASTISFPASSTQGEFFPSTASLSYLDFSSQSSFSYEPAPNNFPNFMLADAEDPLTFAISNVSLHDLNMNLWVLCMPTLSSSHSGTAE